MSYAEERRKLTNKIFKELGPLSITQLHDVLTFVEEKKPLSLTEYIKEHIGHGTYGCDDVFRKPEVLKAFEHEVRAICLELGPDFEKIETSSQYIDHFYEMYVQGEEIDIWIQENGSMFNTYELAHIIYLLYTGEVIFG